MRWLCLVGDPVEKSLSPEMHNAALAHLGLDRQLIFVKRRVSRSELPAFMRTLETDDFAGLAVTMPHKAAVIPYLDYVSAEAELAGAVNTVVVRNGTLQGHNTDGMGCVHALRAAEVEVAKSSVLVLGAGGAARAAAFALAGQSPGRLIVVNRTASSARQLASEVAGQTGVEAAWGGLEDLRVAVKKSEILVSAVPEPPAHIPVRMDMAVLDMAYGKGDTQLIRAARSVGARAIPGTEMLLRQGALQFELFTGRQAPAGVMRMELDRASRRPE